MSHFYFMMFSDQDDFSDFFAGDENRPSWNNRRPGNRWSTDRDDQREKNRFNRDKTGERRPDNRYNHGNGYRDRRPDDNVDDERYNNHYGGHGNDEERYRDRYHVNTQRVNDDREEYLDSASTAAMFFKRRQAMNHQAGKDKQETHLSYGK